MAVERLSRKGRRFIKRIKRAKTRYELQQLASEIQAELDKRNLSFDETLVVGNILQARVDMLPGDEIVYAISDRDSYRKTLELYLRDGILTATEQLLLWEERRRLGINDDDHELLMDQLLAIWKRQGKNVTIHQWRRPGGETSA